MAAKKIIFFTAGMIPTTNELIDIAKLNALAGEAYQVKVKRGDVPGDQNYGSGKEDCDYVAVTSPYTVPTAYNAKTPFNANKPVNGGNLLATQTIVASGQKYSPITVTGSGTFATFTVAGGVITGIVLSSS